MEETRSSSAERTFSSSQSQSDSDATNVEHSATLPSEDPSPSGSISISNSAPTNVAEAEAPSGNPELPVQRQLSSTPVFSAKSFQISNENRQSILMGFTKRNLRELTPFVDLIYERWLLINM